MIPDYQSIMLPLLQATADGEEYTRKELAERVAKQMAVSEDEQRELLPSGTQRIFDNRAGWAITYLKKAGLLASPKRGVFMVTELGKQTLAKNPTRIDIKYLERFDLFVEFRQTKHKITSKSESVVAEELTDGFLNRQTPEENLGIAYQSIINSLASELLEKVLEASPAFFERLVIELLVKMGYGGSMADAGRAIGKSGDEGIDGIIKEDKLGLDVIYIQAKRWKIGNVVGRPDIQKFVGALAGQGAKKGIFITTSHFTKDARDYVPRNETKIVLIDGEQLSQLMMDYNLGCNTHQTYELKKIDNDYFDEE